MDNFIFTVTQVNDYVRNLLGRDPLLKDVTIRGEISNFKFHSSGHMYFSLKDEGALIRCVMFRQYNLGLGFLPRNGMSVIVKGYISLYCKDGQYQLYVENMKEDGLGMLFLAFEAMKKKLFEQGLFDQQFKKSIPVLPKKIGVVTSHTGAAIRDIVNIATRRYPNVEILIVPARVQGDGAALEIAWAIDYLNTRQDIDVIIVGRGGGSIEELWPFNEECVAQSIFRSRIPIISAVGHETDYTISDFVADVRAPTPSAAAELAVPLKTDIANAIEQLHHRMILALNSLVMQKRHMLKGLAESQVFTRPFQRIEQQQQLLDYLNKNLYDQMERILEKKKECLKRYMEGIHRMNPLAVLGRGYSLLQDTSDNTINSVKDLHPGKRVTIVLKDGKAGAVIENTMVTATMDE